MSEQKSTSAEKPKVMLAACLTCSTLKLANEACTRCGDSRNYPGTLREAAR